MLSIIMSFILSPEFSTSFPTGPITFRSNAFCIILSERTINFKKKKVQQRET